MLPALMYSFTFGLTPLIIYAPISPFRVMSHWAVYSWNLVLFGDAKLKERFHIPHILVIVYLCHVMLQYQVICQFRWPSHNDLLCLLLYSCHEMLDVKVCILDVKCLFVHKHQLRLLSTLH